MIQSARDSVIDMAQNNEKIKVLIVDDEKIALKNLSQFLEREGYSVITADNGIDAINILEESSFDVVLTDLKMAVVDGISILNKTRSKSPDTKVVIFTGYSTVETAIEAMKKGAFHYIEKPLKFDTVRAVINDAVGKSI